jgi:hypothetical protein
MLLIRSRNALLIGLILACTVGLYLSTVKPSKNYSNHSVIQNGNLTYTKETADEPVNMQPLKSNTKNFPAVGKSTQKKISSIVEQYRTVMGNAAESGEVKDWFNRMGYSAFDTNEYSSYNLDALKELAKSGDIRAINLLAQQIFGIEGYDASKALYLEGAARGSTDSISSLARITYSENFNSYASDAEKLKASVEMLAWSKVAGLRGDEFASANSGRLLLSLDKVAITNEMEALSNELASEYYQHLQAKRNELGLGPFDNSVPNSVKNFFEQIK